MENKPRSTIQTTVDNDSNSDDDIGPVIKTKSSFSRQLTNLKDTIVEKQLVERLEMYGCAVLSIFDMASDTIMIAKYNASGRERYATATIVCLLLCLTSQVLNTYLQNRKMRRQRQLKEQLLVLTLIKPVIDIWRAANHSESKREKGTLVDPKSELRMNRNVEMMFEALPGTVIQMAAIVSAKEIDSVMYFALMSSMVSAAILSTYTSLDWNTDKENRKCDPDFFGYVPDGHVRKIVVFLSLFCASMFNLLVSSLACVLLHQRGMHVVVIALGSELAIFLFLKILQRDILHWAPIYGIQAYFIAALGRITVKVLGDWTFYVHFRHPQEVGGAHLAFGSLCTVTIGILFLYLVDEVEGLFEKATIVKIMIAGIGGLLLSCIVFLCSIDQKYISMFISTQTGN